MASFQIDSDAGVNRKRFAKLSADAEKIRAKSNPLREERDALVREADLKRQKLDERIAKHEEGLFDIEQERAALSRVLGGRVVEETEAEA